MKHKLFIICLNNRLRVNRATLINHWSHTLTVQSEYCCERRQHCGFSLLIHLWYYCDSGYKKKWDGQIKIIDINITLNRVFSLFLICLCNSLQSLGFVQMWQQRLHAVISEFTVTEIQFCQSFRIFQKQSQLFTSSLVHLSVTEVHLSSQSPWKSLSTPQRASLRCINTSQTLQQQRFTTADEKKENRRTNMNVRITHRDFIIR